MNFPPTHQSIPSSPPSPARRAGPTFHRRTLLKAAGASGLCWLTPLAERLARADEATPLGEPAQSVILLWLAGGPSQLETFDPHPRTNIAGGTGAVRTNVDGVQLAAGMPRTAEQMEKLAIVRNVVSKEGDHERASYNVKTGYRPDPTLTHPSLGSIICHQLPVAGAEIPRHVSILPNQWPGRGGYLGDAYDAFKTFDPADRIPDVTARVDEDRFQERLADLDVVEQVFARGRLREMEERRTLHRTQIEGAVRMMSSEQLTAFDVSQEPESVREPYGNTPFGRGCLAALRLIEVGVRCVEVTLQGFDSHVNNHEAHRERTATLDPALAALLADLEARERLDRTIVIVGGEFGRTPNINPAGGRDHWPHGFSIALAGGGIRGGQVIGETDPEGERVEYEAGTPVENVHATVLRALDINYRRELQTPVGRPMRISDGRVVEALLNG